MKIIRELIAHMTVPRCIVCGTRQDRPADVCRGANTIGFVHIWERND